MTRGRHKLSSSRWRFEIEREIFRALRFPLIRPQTSPVIPSARKYPSGSSRWMIAQSSVTRLNLEMMRGSRRGTLADNSLDFNFRTIWGTRYRLTLELSSDLKCDIDAFEK